MAYNIIACSMKLGQKTSCDNITQASKYVFLDFSVTVVVTFSCSKNEFKVAAH